ncbi:MAG: hypothetical protein BGO52_05955 [Sphingobacteriales bacterium 44-61]|nr:MAG: hypothetical protein BGO52_05955 [Sphingobacteriales bacterium 44-61]
MLPQSEDERKLDKLLGLFSNISQLFEMKIIKKEDLDFIKYEFQILYEYPGVQKYFETLDEWFERRKIDHLKFNPFRRVGKLIIGNNFNVNKSGLKARSEIIATLKEIENGKFFIFKTLQMGRRNLALQAGCRLCKKACKSSQSESQCVLL